MYLNLVREISTAITNSESLPEEFLVELANEYAGACDVVNEKLLDVSKLLKIGCRDEAVQVAEQPRSVLESVRELNFGARKDWLAVLSEKKLELPPRLDFHSAVMLEKAYERLEELNSLLKKNRLLALAQAPLASRILILKKLAERDSENPVWKQDLVNLQEARLRAMGDECRIVAKQQDAEKLSALMEELQGQWDVEVPRSLVANVRDALNSIGMESHLKKMEVVAKQLNDALVETDAQTGRQLRQRWFELNRVANLGAGDPMVQSLREPMRWLEELDQEVVAEQNYAKTVAQLKQAVGAGASVEEIDKRISLVENFGRPDSASLLKQAKLYRKSVVKEQQQQSRVLRFGLIGAGVLVAGFAAWFGVSQNRSSNLIDSREQLRVMIQQKTYGQGVELFETFPNFVKQDSEIIGLHSQLVQFHDAEESRKKGLSDLFASFDLEGELGDELDDRLMEARKIATAKDDRAKIDQLKVLLDDRRLEKQKLGSDQFLQQLKPLQAKLDTILAKVKEGSAAVSVLNPVAEETKTFLQSSLVRTEGLPGISAAAKAKADRLIDQIAGLQQRARVAKKSTESLGDLAKRVRRVNQLDEALQRYVDRFPNDPNARDFASTIEEADHLSGIRAWGEVAEFVQRYSIDSLSKNQLIDLQVDLNEAIEQTELANWRDSVEALRKHLSLVLSDDGAIESERRSMQSFFEQKRYMEISVIHRDGLRYYLLHDFDTADKRFSYFVRGANQRERKYKSEDIGGLAGHCKIAKSVLRLLQQPVYDIDAQIVKLLDKALVESQSLSNVNGPTIDPLAQCEMVDRILEYAEQVSPTLTKFSEEQRSILQEDRVIGLAWRNVEDDGAQAMRPRAEKILARVRNNLPATRELIEQKSNLLQQWAQVANYRAAGLLYRQHGQWVVDPVSPDEIAEGETLYCLIPGRRNVSSLEVVGKFANGSIDRVDAVLALQAGRPVFVIREN